MFLMVFAFLSGAKPLASYRGEPRAQLKGQPLLPPKTSPGGAGVISSLHVWNRSFPFSFEEDSI